jgi:hypothetical protein
MSEGQRDIFMIRYAIHSRDHVALLPPLPEEWRGWHSQVLRETICGAVETAVALGIVAPVVVQCSGPYLPDTEKDASND